MQIFKFMPLFKETLWGGSRIALLKGLENLKGNIGESWEISGVKGNETIVSNGRYRGTSLNQLVATLKADLVGEANYLRFGNEFPLLIKLIDAQQDLSVQVHPSDEIALQQGKTRGKTEMWYVLNSSPGAKLYNGLSRQLTPEEFAQKVADRTITDALVQHEVCEDDVFFIPAGRIHAIGAGCMVAEIQQTSDVTYRIYDFDRRDKDGNLRQLHVSEAAECIDYHVYDNYRTHYRLKPDERVNAVRCPYFTTNIIDITKETILNYDAFNSFVVLIAVKGEGCLKSVDGEQFPLSTGETVLIPASVPIIRIDGCVKIIETYIS